MSGTLRDLFDLPRDAGKTTFVVKLTDAVTHPELLLRDYAVTPGIAGALDHALDHLPCVPSFYSLYAELKSAISSPIIWPAD